MSIHKPIRLQPRKASEGQVREAVDYLMSNNIHWYIDDYGCDTAGLAEFGKYAVVLAMHIDYLMSQPPEER